MNTVELVLCKTVATESFPDRGWIGIVAPTKQGSTLVELYTRCQMYGHVQKIMQHYGEESVRQEVARFKVPSGYCLMFASAKDAKNDQQARSLIETHLRT